MVGEGGGEPRLRTIPCASLNAIEGLSLLPVDNFARDRILAVELFKRKEVI
jgi:hypothetical protein